MTRFQEWLLSTKGRSYFAYHFPTDTVYTLSSALYLEIEASLSNQGSYDIEKLNGRSGANELTSMPDLPSSVPFPSYGGIPYNAS